MPDAIIRPRQRVVTAISPHSGNPNVLIPKRQLIHVVSVSGGWQIDAPFGATYDAANNDGTVLPEIVFAGILPGIDYRVTFDVTTFDGIGVPAADILLEGYLGTNVPAGPTIFKLDNLGNPAPFAVDVTDTAGSDNNQFRLVANDNTTVSLIVIENASIRRV